MSDTKKCISTLDMEKVSAVLLDVAGTTTAISFVKETLYPYIIKNAEEFLKSNFESEDIKKALEKFEEKDLDATKAAEAVKNLTEKDGSNEGLKTIQGMLLKRGYENGELKGHVFDDVPKLFNSCSATKKIAIFSSGSVESQQLLFKNSTEGDLSLHIKKFFDLSFGSKVESETYKKIAKDLEVEPADLLFLTDDLKEAEAAKSADVNVIIVEREGNASIPEESQANFTVVKSFTEIQVEKLKRKIVEEEAAVEEPPTKMAKIDVAEEVVEKVENEAKSEENDKVETAVEAMEVDQGTISEEKAEEVSSEDTKSESKKTTDQEKKVESEKIETSEKVTGNPDAMEVDSKSDNSNVEKTNQTTEKPTEVSKNKTETEIGTQTKCAVTNECETQTTISLAAVEELPVKKVEDILMSTENDPATEKKVEQKPENEDVEKKSEEPLKEAEGKKNDETEKESVTTDQAKEQKEENDDKNNADVQNGNLEETKENNAQDKEEKAEAKEDHTKVEGDNVTKDIKEAVEVTEKVEENVKSEENGEKVVDNSNECTKDNSEVKENGNSCKKGNEEKEGEKKESINDKKEETATSNGDAPKTKENGHEDEQAAKEKENESKLANGKEIEASNGEAASITTNGSVDQKDEELKVKKITDNVESAPVSVEA